MVDQQAKREGTRLRRAGRYADVLERTPKSPATANRPSRAKLAEPARPCCRRGCRSAPRGWCCSTGAVLEERRRLLRFAADLGEASAAVRGSRRGTVGCRRLLLNRAFLSAVFAAKRQALLDRRRRHGRRLPGIFGILRRRSRCARRMSSRAAVRRGDQVLLGVIGSIRLWNRRAEIVRRKCRRQRHLSGRQHRVGPCRDPGPSKRSRKVVMCGWARSAFMSMIDRSPLCQRRPVSTSVDGPPCRRRPAHP